VAHSGDEIAKIVGLQQGQNSAAGLIRDLRDRISGALQREADIQCGRYDVILSRGRGYRFADCVTVHDGEQPNAKQSTDIDVECDVRNVRNDDVRNVPDDVAEARRAWIVQRLEEGHQLQAPAVVKQFGCSVKTAQRDLAALKEEGKIEFVGATRTGCYRLRPPPAIGD
jgi:hypothetical protein